MNTVARASGQAQSRTDRKAQLVRLLHVAKRELQLDDETYRTVLRTASRGRSESSGNMEVPELERALDQMKRGGFKVRSNTNKTASPARAPAPTADRRQDTRSEARKVRALWLFLHALGVVRDPSERALATYCKRIAKVDDLHWAHGDAMHKLIETLKKWAMRDALPNAVSELRLELAEAFKSQHTPERAEQLALAYKRCMFLQFRGQGFDIQWLMWESLMEGLGRPIPGDMAASGAVETKP